MGFSLLPSDHPLLQKKPLWHADCDSAREGHTLLLCRKRIHLESDSNLKFWVSASQRFIFYLDCKLTGRGPSRSDQDRWGVRCYELSLKKGEHVFALIVTHRGRLAGKAQLGGPGFLAAALEGVGRIVESPWRSFHHRAYHPVLKRKGTQKGHLSVGAGEEFHGSGFPWDWKGLDFDDSEWSEMQAVAPTFQNPWGNRIGDHLFRMDPLPEMFERSIAPAEEHSLFPQTIPAHTEWSQVVDMGRLVNAYLSVIVSLGKGSRIEIVSCEAPMDPESGAKGDRDVITGKNLPGMLDRFLPGGTTKEVCETTWFRAFRYLEIRVSTMDEALEFEEIRFAETRFPFKEKSEILIPDTRDDWPKLFEITERTAQLCAHETTFDCPHYEQGQFSGDTRIQAIYHYLRYDDDRLIRKAIDDLAASRVSEGLLRSHYPADYHQIIPTFSLYWIGILNDFRVYRGDGHFLQSYLPQAREIIQWYASKRRADGLVSKIPFAPFIDWAYEYGNAPQNDSGGSIILSCLFARACCWMERLEAFVGYPELNSKWRALAAEMVESISRYRHDSGLFPDVAEGAPSSLHAQTEAILAGCFEEETAGDVLTQYLDASSLRQPSSFYYRYYVAQAASACGRNDLTHRILRPWFSILNGTGLTTLPENVEDPRSDCHAWSVFSGIAPITHIAGLKPCEASSGMGKLIWQPAMGDIPSISVQFKTPHGPVSARLQNSSGVITGEIDSPVPVHLLESGEQLDAGKHEVSMPRPSSSNTS